MRIDHDALSRDLVRVARGSRSQTAMARRLGVEPHTVYSWESGRRRPTALRFLRAAERLGLDPAGSLAGFIGPEDPELCTPRGIVRFLGACRGDMPIATIAERTGRSRFAVSRWLRGRAEPRLPDFLRLVDATTLRLLDLVARFCDPATLRSVDEEWAQLQAARDLAWDAPWTQGVLLALTLPGYRALSAHDDAWLGRALGIPTREAERCVQQLLAAGQIVEEGSRYAPVAVQTVDLRRPGSGSALKQHWMEVAAQRVDQGQGVFSYNVFTLGGTELAELERMQRAYYRQVRAFVANAPPGDRVVLMNLQLLPLGDPA